MKTKSALLLTSTQHDLLHPTGLAWGLVGETVTRNRVVPHLQQLAQAARRAGLPVLHSPVELDHAALKDFAPRSAIQQLMIGNRLLAKGSAGVRFLAELAPQPEDIVLPPRSGFSSFWANDIGARLKELGVQDLYIAGMLAHACVESHARDAVENGYRPFVIRDAIGAAGDGLLQASCTILEVHAFELLTTDQAVERWQSAARVSGT